MNKTKMILITLITLVLAPGFQAIAGEKKLSATFLENADFHTKLEFLYGLNEPEAQESKKPKIIEACGTRDGYWECDTLVKRGCPTTIQIYDWDDGVTYDCDYTCKDQEKCTDCDVSNCVAR